MVDRFNVFARLSPAHKQRIVKALQKKGHTVGFMGDGINDAPALRAADVGVSVDNAVDIAKESADVILLEKSLMVLEEGVLEGRKVFVNILKYVRMGASSNFGNMFSVIGASAWLPFVPMAPIQVLTNNLLYDFSQVPIPTDNVGPQQIAKPRPWHIGEIAKFIVCIGPISSIFDYTTYGIMWFIFKCNDLRLVPPAELAARFANTASTEQTYAAALFHTGWFVESLMTQTLIIHVIRTNLIPHHSRHSHQSHSVHSVTSQLATHYDHGHHHGVCRISSLFASRDFPRVCSATVALLAASVVDVDLLCGANTSHQDLAHPQDLGLKNSRRSCRLANRKDESASPHNHELG